MTKNTIKSNASQSTLSTFIIHVKKLPKAKIAFTFFALGSPFIYWGLVLAVLYNPDILTWLRLEPFVQYLIQLQSSGYENLVQLRDPEFADYFFHAASLLVLGTINSLFVIFVILFLNDLPKFYKDYLLYTHCFNLHSSKFFLKYDIVLTPLILIVLGWFMMFAPSHMSYGGRFPPNFFGIGLFMFSWAVFSFLFQSYLIMVKSKISHVFFPKLKNLLGGKQ